MCGTSEGGPAARAGAGSPTGVTGFTQQGLCAYYASRFAGRRTASGERYDPQAMTAAHLTLPFGTWVAVTRTDVPGRRVEVRVNDRGPYGKGRVIDVSGAAARKLDLLRKGVAPVRLEVLPRRTQP